MTDPYGYQQNQPHYQGGFNPYAQNPGQYPYGQQSFRPPRTEPMAIVSLILSLVGLATCGATALPGAILGHVAMRKIRNDPQLEGEGLAKGGIIAGWIIFGLAFLFWVGYIIFIVFLINQNGSYPS
jgi:Domain of unknown function (DUF4190)